MFSVGIDVFSTTMMTSISSPAVSAMRDAGDSKTQGAVEAAAMVEEVAVLPLALGRYVVNPFRAWSGSPIESPEGAMLSMDGNPLKFDSKRRIFGGHLEVDRQLPDGILPPRRVSIKDIHNGVLA